MKYKILAGLAVLAMLCGFGYYTLPPLAAFNPTGQTVMSVTTSSASAALPTYGLSTPTATTLLVSNVGSSYAYVNLGTSAVTASSAVGFVVPANSVSIPIAIRSASYVAASGAGSTTLVITTGY